MTADKIPARIFIDIDGTLTSEPHKKWGPPIHERIQRVRDLIAAGNEVVIWTGGGTAYAAEFAAKYHLDGALCVGKPSVLVDDNPELRPGFAKRIKDPTEFFGMLP